MGSGAHLRQDGHHGWCASVFGGGGAHRHRGLLWLLFAIFARKYLYIYPAGLLGCIVVGVVNGIGSLFFYSGLGLLDASLVQLLERNVRRLRRHAGAGGGEPADARPSPAFGLALAGIIRSPGGQRAGQSGWALGSSRRAARPLRRTRLSAST